MLDNDCISKIFKYITDFDNHISLSAVNKAFNYISYSYIHTIPYNICERLIKTNKFNHAVNKYNKIDNLNLIGIIVQNIDNIINKCNKIYVCKDNKLDIIPDNVIVSDKEYYKIIDVDNIERLCDIFNKNLYDSSKSHDIYEGPLYEKYHYKKLFGDYINNHNNDKMGFIIVSVGTRNNMYANIIRKNKKIGNHTYSYKCNINGGGYNFDFVL